MAVMPALEWLRVDVERQFPEGDAALRALLKELLAAHPLLTTFECRKGPAETSYYYLTA